MKTLMKRMIAATSAALIATVILAACEEVIAPPPTVLQIVLPEDYTGAFKIIPARESSAYPPIINGQEARWDVPKDGILKVKSTAELSDRNLQIIVRYENGNPLPIYDLKNMASDFGVFKMYTESGGEHIWFVGSGDGRRLAYELPRDSLPMGVDPHEHALNRAEQVDKEMSTTKPPW